MAHPGNTASDGCHYCRTNCARWGQVHGARHCHGSSFVPPIPSIPKPVDNEIKFEKEISAIKNKIKYILSELNDLKKKFKTKKHKIEPYEIASVPAYVFVEMDGEEYQCSKI